MAEQFGGSDLSFLKGGGETGALLRDADWQDSPLGLPSRWTPELKTVVGIAMGSRQPMLIVWGPEQTTLYNDGYAAMCGQRHPAALGGSFQSLWFDIWDQVKPIITDAYEGIPTAMDDIAFIMHRNGFPEETHFSFSYNPVRDTAGTVLGMFCVCAETTQQVIADRRIAAEAERQRQNLQAMPGFVAMLHGPDHTYGYVNEAYLTIGGPRDYLGHTVREVFPELAGQGFYEMLDGVYATGTPVNLKATPILLEGEEGERYIDLLYSPVRDDLGNIAGIFVGGYDVTERVRASRDLEALNADLELKVLERAHEMGVTWNVNPDLLAVVNIEGRFVTTNPAWTHTLGYSAEEMRAFLYVDLLHPDDIASAQEALAELATGKPVLEVENRYRTKDGNYRWFSWVCVPEGDKIYCIVRDVTAEKTARAERDQMWRLSADMLARAAYTGEMSAVNPAWTAVLGWSEHELLTNPYVDIMHPDDVAATTEALQRMGRTGEPTRFENRLLTKARQWKPIGWTVAPEPDGQNFIAVGRDLTEDKAREAELADAQESLRQSQKMEAVGQLTGGLAHDFNNILAGIGGSLEMMGTRLSQGRIADLDRYITGATGAARRAMGLTQRLLAFSRRQTLDPKPTDLNNLVNGMLDLINRSVGPEIAVETVSAAGLWATFVDAGQLENALLNLCINSRDAMPHGGKLTIETGNRWMDERSAKERGLEPGQYVSLCVSDTGTGMPPDVIARAFDPFYTTKPIGQGTGLGLSMVYGFAGQSGGSVRIYSEIDQGTMICIYLPRHAEDVKAEEIATVESAAPRADGGETILLVDDEPLVRMIATEQLEELGYVVIEAGDGPSALRILNSEREINLLITDVGLPNGMNGRQVADAARVARPGLEVLFITGYAENAVLNHGHLDQGMHVMTKPFQMDTFARRVKELIAKDAKR